MIEGEPKQEVLPPLPAHTDDVLRQTKALSRSLRMFRQLTSNPVFPQVYGQLVANRSVYQIVEWMRQNVPADDPLMQLTDTALTSRLYRFRKAMPAEAFLPQPAYDALYKRPHATIDVLDEMAAIVRYQKDRVEMFRGREKTFPVTVEQQRKEVTALMEFLKDYNGTAVMLGATKPHVPVIANIGGGTTVVGPGLSLTDMLKADPSLIPEAMETLDKIDAIEAQFTEVEDGPAAGGSSPADEG